MRAKVGAVLFALLAAALVAIACSEFKATDAPAADASVEAGAEADGGSNDAGTSECALAIDFDSSFPSTDSVVTWTTYQNNGNIDVTSMLPDGAVPPSPPFALYARGNVPDGGDDGVSARVTQMFSVVPSSLVMKYALLVPSASGYAGVGCEVQFSDFADVFSKVDVAMAQDGILYARRRFADAGEDYERVALQPKEWAAVEIEATIDRDGGTVVASIQVTQHDGSVTRLPPAPIDLPPGAKGIKIVCGIGYADFGGTTGGSDRVEAVIDDLSIRGCK